MSSKHPVDIHVGKRIRQRRWMVGMTQQKLGELVGINFQQIQKYETGLNRVSASRLWGIAQALGVPVSFFFEGLPQDDEVVLEAEKTAEAISSQEVAELVGGFLEMSDEQQVAVSALVKSIIAK